MRSDLSAPLVPEGIKRPSAMSDDQGFRKLSSTSDDVWCVGMPSRQNTGDSIASTVATEGDLLSPKPGKARGFLGEPISPKPSAGARVLETVGERRGWKHFLRHVVPGYVAFVVGIVLGLAGAWFLDLYLHAHGEKPVPQEPYQLAAPPTDVPEEYLRSPSFNNACLIQHLKIPDGPRTFDACGFVINSTDELWNRRGSDVDASIDKYFHQGYLNAGSWGKRGVGHAALRAAVFSEMRAFPDIRIHITDCQCAGNDFDGYKCSMPDILEGTNTGPSAYGPATGRYARWTGMVQSFVKQNPENGQWQYYAEWGVHDEWALIQQLGLDFARVPHPPTNPEPFHDCTPLLRLIPGAPALDVDDAAVSPRAAKDAMLRGA